MQPVLYIDVLIVMNTVITFFLLMSTAEITRLHPTPGRITVASFVGGAYALIILAPAMNLVFTLLTKAVMGVTLVGIAYPFRKIKGYFKGLTVFLLMSFLYAGVVYALQYAFSAEYIRVNNGFAYYNLSSSVIIGICLFISLIIKAVNSGFFRNSEKNNIYKTEIYCGDKSVCTNALFDTGNELRDAYTNAPVIVLCRAEANELTGNTAEYFSMDLSQTPSLPIRLIPVKSVAGQSILPAFTVDKAVIYTDSTFRTLYRPTVAVTDDSLGKEKYRALINCDSV